MPEPESNSSESSLPDLTSLGWVANYPPWYGGAVAKAAGCKTREEGHRLLHLMRSIEDSKPDDTRRLLAEGIDANLQLPTEDRTLFEWAAEKNKHPDCFRALLQAGANAKSSKALGSILKYGRHELLLDLLNNGASPNARLPGGDTPLGSAAATGIVESVRILLNAGADINCTSTFSLGRGKEVSNCTPLMIAAYNGHAPIVKLLITSGADVNRSDSAGNNAIAWARTSYAKAKGAKCIALLEKAGATASAAADLGIPQPPDFSTRAKSAEFKKAVTLARKITKSAATSVELAEGPLPGAKAFPVEKNDARTLLKTLRDQIKDLKSVAFLSEDVTEFNVPCIVLLPTTDFYEAITAFETPEGQSLSNAELIKWLKALHKEQPFEITHICPDLIRADFTSEIRNPRVLAESIQKICPDVINEPLQKVAAALAKSRELYLWWD